MAISGSITTRREGTRFEDLRRGREFRRCSGGEVDCLELAAVTAQHLQQYSRARTVIFEHALQKLFPVIELRDLRSSSQSNKCSRVLLPNESHLT